MFLPVSVTHSLGFVLQFYQQSPSHLAVFFETFWVILVAELADKSMFSTIALATTQNPYSVFLGASF